MSTTPTGAATNAAVERQQFMHDLEPEGIFGPLTRVTMGPG